MHSIVVFCGSKKGNQPIYEEIAFKTGKLFAANNIRLVYGGGGVGLMGVIARTTMANNGEVVGIIPDFLSAIEGIDSDITETHVVETMHERKQLMAAKSDAVLVLPGAYGTLDELFEMLTLSQLNRGSWPIGILNINGYYDHLIAHVDLMNREGFLNNDSKNLFIVNDNLETLVNQLLLSVRENVYPSSEAIEKL